MTCDDVSSLYQRCRSQEDVARLTDSELLAMRQHTADCELCQQRAAEVIRTSLERLKDPVAINRALVSAYQRVIKLETSTDPELTGQQSAEISKRRY